MPVVVVESPAKAKTINKYLGSEYTVLASYGHVRDLPPKDGSVDPEQGFAMEWEIASDSKKHVKAIADALKDDPALILATDPDREGDSLGTHIILDHIEIARELGLPYVYLGYWVPGSPKMGYKAKFDALEVYSRGRWRPMYNPADFEDDVHPLSVEPIAEQVAKIVLPDIRPATRA